MKDYNNIKLLIVDCDGVLSDGKVIYDNHHVESKNFSAKDGLGIKMLSFSNIGIAVITGRDSEILVRRCKDLGISHLYQKVRNKLKKANELLKELDLSWENVACIGDDWNDYPILKKAYISAVPADAFEDIKKKVDIITKRNGGHGAVRELIELILKKQGIYESTLEKFINHLEKM